MAGWVERWPDLVSPAPGGPDDPLGQSVADPANPAVRLFEPRHRCLVLGRSQDPERELHCAAARAAGVPIHRRVTGGGAVLLGPGTVVVAWRLAREAIGTDCYFAQVNDHLLPALRSLTDRPLACRGHGDLCISVDGQWRKILGASQRQTRDHVIYLGVILVADLVADIESLLRAPSREPAYRGGRSHGDFCWPLTREGADTAAVIGALRLALAAG